MTPEEYEARKAARKASADEARKAQLAIDLDALFALEEEHGDGMVKRLDLSAYFEGLPTLVAVRAPKPVEYKRFRDMIRKAKDKEAQGKAADLLGTVCRAYPDADTYAKILERFPGVQDTVFKAAAELGDATIADEGKG